MLHKALLTTALALASALITTASSWAGVDTKDLKLFDAYGVPSEPSHKYIVNGYIYFFPTPKGGEFVGPYEKFWAEGKGIWDQNKGLADEVFVFKGTIEGQLVSTFKCQKDPWLYKTSCFLKKAQFESQKGKLYDWNAILKERGRPLSTGAVTLASATELSKKHTATGPPPPPPPKVKEPTKLSNTPVPSVSAGSPSLKVAPDLTSDSEVMLIGKVAQKTGKWGETIQVQDAEAKSILNGRCQFFLTYTVRNQSPTSTGAYSSKFQVNDGKPDYRLNTTLGPNSIEKKSEMAFLKPGLNTLYLNLDDDAKVGESNEDNNQFKVLVNVSGKCGALSADQSQSPVQESGKPPGAGASQLPAGQQPTRPTEQKR